VVSVIRARICDVVQNLLSIQAIALSDSQQTNRSEGTLSVDVEAFAFTAAHAHRKLARNGKGMANLRLSSPEFSKHLGYSASFDPAWDESAAEYMRVGRLAS
jgi:hypothetical protein